MSKLDRYKQAIERATADGNDAAVAELRRRVQEAADRAAKDDNQEAFASIMTVLTGETRADLEEQAVQADAARAQAGRMLQGSQDSIGENLMEGAGELAAGVNSLAVGGADVLTSPLRALYNQFAGEDKQMGSVSDLFPEGYKPGVGGFIEEPGVAKTVRTIGEGVAMGAGFAPIERAASVGSFAAELLGLGATETPAAAIAAQKVADAFETATNAGELGTYSKVFRGVSDTISAKISPQLGARVQRADETAMRTNAKEMTTYVEPIIKSIKLADEDEVFKGMLLDYGQGKLSKDKIFTYVDDKIDREEAKNVMRYLNWSASRNSRYNKAIGDSAQSGDNYLHTQVRDDSKITGRGKTRRLEQKQSATDGANTFDDDTLATDFASMDRQRGLAASGEVRVGEYENPLLSNARRIQHNERLLELSRKLGMKDVSGGPNAWLDALEKKVAAKGIDEAGARDARNAIAVLLKGQNKAPAPLMQALQSTIYLGTLAGPKSAVLNLQDIGTAAVNNGIGSLAGLVKRNGADLKRLGIDGQTMGEFTQNVASVAKDRSKSQIAANVANKIASGSMRAVGFRLLDRLGKEGVLSSVGEGARKLAVEGKLATKWGDYFDSAEITTLQNALKSSGGDVAKMSKKEAALYDELLVAGLGQQQLISAAGRPLAWLNNPNARILYVMRGFAVKQQALLMRNVVEELQKGNGKKAASYAAAYVTYGGGSYAALNQGRQELFGGEEASLEGGIRDVLDQMAAAATLNSLSLSPYAIDRMKKNGITQELLMSVLPPGGAAGEALDAVVDALIKQDPEELTRVITRLPAYKQIEALIE